MNFKELFIECFKDNLSHITKELNYQNSYKIKDYSNVELYWSTKECYFVKTEYYFKNFTLEKLNHKFHFIIDTIKPFISNEKLDLTYKLNKIDNNDIYINVFKKVDNELDNLNDIVDIFSEKEIKSIISKFKKTIIAEDKFLHKNPTQWIKENWEEFYKNKLIQNIDNNVVFQELKNNKQSYLDELNLICNIEENKVIEFNKVPEEFKDIKQKENYLFCSDNYKVLRALEDQKINIDVIYIDPPYNTKNNSFVYNDNMEENTWLTFMENRLRIAHKLLNDDGVIFCSIDDNQLYKLKTLFDIVFLKENFISNIIWKKTGQQQNNGTNIANIMEYIICFSKKLHDSKKQKKQILSKDNILNRKGGAAYKYIDEKGLYSTLPIKHSKFGKFNWSYNHNNIIFNSDHWVIDKIEFLELLEKKEISFGSNNIAIPRRKKYLLSNNGVLLNNFIDNIYNEQSSLEISNMFGKNTFNYSKPINLIKKIISMYNCNKNLTILDFFAGSGTTGCSLKELNNELNLNSNFILCTTNENNLCNKITNTRLKNYNIDFNYIKE